MARLYKKEKSYCKYILAGGLVLPAFYSFGQTATVDSLSRVHTIGEVVVRGFGAERNLKAPEMGHVTFDNKAITNLPVLFGEPDIVKALQTIPGVSQGVEGFTGLYVRGGDNDQNLFLYSGLPLYHVSHLGGVFSSFNVAIVSQVDFYKSAFPAQYGGRISSITDVSMKRPDFERLHGDFTLGLLSANGFITGPLIKDRTAFAVGVRRSWIDIISAPTLAIMNAIEKKNGKKHIASYNFMDFNARVDQRISHNASAYVLGYYGHDYLKIGEREFEADNMGYVQKPDGTWVKDDTQPTPYFDENTNRMSWGNWGVLGAVEWRVGMGTWTTSAYYSKYSSDYRQEREYQSDIDDSDTYGYSRSRTENSIADIGVRTEYSADFSKLYHLRVGASYVHHDYLPEGLKNEFLSTGKNGEGSVDANGNPRISACEYAGYIDNTLDLWDVLALSAGARVTSYVIQGHAFKNLEPRASVKLSLARDYSLKASYARMNQYVQQVSSNYINLPTDLWQPITASFKPLCSDQYSAGLYGSLPGNMYFSVEGWYKDMKNLLEYREGVSVLNAGLAWDKKLTSGKGWSYGVDLSLTKETGRLTGSVGCGLMWNWRKFDSLNGGAKFPAKFDNRHKININASYKLNDRIDFNAGWTYMTGNRLTLSMYNYDIPGSQFGDAPTVGPPGYGDEFEGLDYYTSRNNVRMPAYHRLDIGMSMHRNYGNGRRGTWNFGLYNAYCNMNPITIKKDNENNVAFSDKETWHRAFKTLSFIPIIPSVSYTYSF